MPRRLAGFLACFTLLVGSAIQCRAEPGHADPWFAKLPFDKWLSEGEPSDLPWSADILPAEISTHQRLMLRIVVRLHGRELEKRRGAGEFLTLVQYKDNAGRIWQHHTSLDLAKLPVGIGTRQLAIAEYAFVLPGDYSLVIAVCDTSTLEHGLIFRQVQAAPLKPDPLPEAWAGLPAVDFLPPITEPPDVWYLPGVEGRLNLSLATRRRVDIHLLVNITPSSKLAGSIAAMRGNMEALIPTLKVLSQIDVRNGSIETALLDLTHRRVVFEQNVFEQKNGNNLDWDGMRKIFLDAQPGIVDAHTLASRQKMGAFFQSEVMRRLFADAPAEAADEATQIVIVLSGPAFLQDQEPAGPLSLPDNADHRVFYIRYHGLPAPPADDLQRAVAPFNGRLYDAASVEQLREILASILDEISKL
jgi:hypothetical protein